ncbi:hypothetical protein F4804DRAFT_328183 [Jackrogersella minutella]|nr:hypothetical protein F4804DRAFT_328183 [Jackrogersella minutella]
MIVYTDTQFILSGQETAELFKLDTVFFQNWYEYQDEIIRTGANRLASNAIHSTSRPCGLRYL